MEAKCIEDARSWMQFIPLFNISLHFPFIFLFPSTLFKSAVALIMYHSDAYNSF